MIDKDKIIIMTKLAVYEKNHMNEDRRRCNYYLEDYVYIKNFKTRLCVTIAFILYALFDIMQSISQNLVFPTSVISFIDVYISPYLLPWILVLTIYSILSTALYGKKYALSQKRMKEYNRLLKQLNAYEREKVNEERAIYETE